MTRLIIAVLALLMVGVSTAEEEAYPLLRGRQIAEIVSGNTIHVYRPRCAEHIPNEVLYFEEGGRVRAALRECNQPEPEQPTHTGRWTIEQGQFCIRGMDFIECFNMIKVADNTYRRVVGPGGGVAGTGQFTAMVIVNEGNTMGW